MAADEADKAGEAVAVWRLEVARHGGIVMKSFRWYALTSCSKTNKYFTYK